VEVEMYAKLNHAHVVPLLALCHEVEPHFMVMEYPEWGDLKQYLLASRKEKHHKGTSSGKGGVTPGGEDDRRHQKPRAPPLSSSQKLTIIQQIASGMEHLSQFRFVHGDLAARNVLITESLDAKISSVSLTKESPYAQEYSRLIRNKPLPIRWLPVEAIFDDDFSTKSDVHAFAVLVWEIYAQGALPFKDAKDDQLLAAFQEGDVTLTIPSSVPKPLSAVLLNCWSSSPRGRPSFADIVNTLGNVLAESKV
jgi:PTK7 protein tyrosine kinase 7